MAGLSTPAKAQVSEASEARTKKVARQRRQVTSRRSVISLLASPFAAQQAMVLGVSWAARTDHAGSPQPFGDHSRLLHYSPGGNVRRIVASLNLVDLGDVEQVRHHRFDRFGRVAMIPPASAKAVAQLGEVDSPINVDHSNLADDDLVQPHCPIEGGGVVVAAYPTGQQQPGRVDVGM